MSYILPQPLSSTSAATAMTAASAVAAATAALEEQMLAGRADEIHAGTISHSSSVSTPPAHGSRRPQKGATHRRSVARPPKSTHASVIRVISEGSPLPKLPPIPSLENPNALFVSTAGGLPSASLHRRANSVGKEHSTDVALENAVSDKLRMAHMMDLDLAAAWRPPAKLRLGLPSFKFGWRQNKAKQQMRGAKSSGVPVLATTKRKTRWTAQDVNALAEASLYYWNSGSHVDLESLAANLGRAPNDVSDMLEHTLQGYVRFGSTPCWADKDHFFIMGWAAAEFPKNQLLNPVLGGDSSDDQRAESMSKLSSCFSALRCVLCLARELPVFAIDGGKAAHSGHTDLADFREGMRSHESAVAVDTQIASSSLLPFSSSPQAANIITVHGKGSGSAKSIPFVVPDAGSLQGKSLAALAAPPEETESSYHQGTSSVFLAKAETEAIESPGSNALLAVHQGGMVASTAADADANVVAVAIAATGRPRANTVAYSQLSSRDIFKAGTGHRLPQDGGNVDEPRAQIQIVAVLDDPELLPAQSHHALGISTSGSNLDVQFSDLAAETRLKVRRFVDKFIADFPADFRQRVDAQNAGKDGLCVTVDHFENFEYNNDAFYKAIETIYRFTGGSTVYTRNMFFHVQLTHAIRLDCIPESDESWFRVNEFATTVFNKQIEDGRFIVFQAYTDMADSNVNSTGTATAIGNSAEPVGTASAPVGNRVAAVRADRSSNSVVNGGNVFASLFERAFYMDKLANHYVKFLVDNMSDGLSQRVRDYGLIPMPVALQVDEASMLTFDVEIRNMLIAFIWEDIPQSTLESKEIALLRALELLNGKLSRRFGLTTGLLQSALDDQRNEDGDFADDCNIKSISDLHNIPGTLKAQVLGRAFAQCSFNETKHLFFEAMLHDHPFRPVTRDELKEWRARGSSPFGKDVDYELNTRLYKYLQRLQFRPTAKQWLQASAAATLSMLYRTLGAALHKDILAHIDISAYGSRFRDIVLNESLGPASNGPTLGLSQSENTSKSRLSAFGRPPKWVSLLAESSSGRGHTNTARPQYLLPSDGIQNETTHLSATSRAFSPLGSEPLSSNAASIASRGGGSSRSGSNSTSVIKGSGVGQSSRPDFSWIPKTASNVTSHLSASPQPIANRESFHYHDQHGSAMASQSATLPCAVPGPVPFYGYHTPQMAHLYAPYAQQIDPAQQLPVAYAAALVSKTNGAFCYPEIVAAQGPSPDMLAADAAAHGGTRSGDGASMSMVLQKFKEMEDLIRQLQAQSGQ
ncbi:hypothetical protein LPJ66_004073 [Kickxella alabastrina]|uniref:Uncharacterized protein n=1 Tax=Kickxella alabastrina TaxID=61397 RepID=A0ACC1IM57_9FUNG|nr:hypothetical protein LPJ66_004073 [Kickxella alabastrina]